LKTNDILYKITTALSLTNKEILEIYKLEDYNMSEEHLEALLKKRVDKGFEECSYEELGVFLDGLVTFKRGPSPKRPNSDEAVPLTNNLILKKLRIALELKEPETEIIFGLGDATLGKQELKSLFRKESHKNFKACPDALLMAFLEGLDEFYYSGEEI
jgi:uncharacterized protein YehS (DUF1456 family)